MSRVLDAVINREQVQIINNSTMPITYIFCICSDMRLLVDLNHTFWVFFVNFVIRNCVT